MFVLVVNYSVNPALQVRPEEVRMEKLALAQQIVDEAANHLQAVVIAGPGKVDRASSRTDHGFVKSTVELELAPGLWISITITKIAADAAATAEAA